MADVDRDNDLDVVIGSPFSNDPVAIWLNDGRGHFTVSLSPAGVVLVSRPLPS